MTKEEILVKLKEMKLINKTHTMENRILVGDAVNIVNHFLKTNPNLFNDNTPKPPQNNETKPNTGTTYGKYRDMFYAAVDPSNVSVFVQNATIYNCNANNAINGTFFWQGKPNGIIIQDGKALCSASSHAWRGYPQSVIYCDVDGKVGITVIKSSSAFPHIERVKWAIGGFSLINPSGSSPEKEGFNAQYADVLRNTYKTSVGYNPERDKIILAIHLRSTSYTNQRLDMQSIGCKFAIGLDGGGSTTMKVNGAVKLNTGRLLNNFITWK